MDHRAGYPDGVLARFGFQHLSDLGGDLYSVPCFYYNSDADIYGGACCCIDSSSSSSVIQREHCCFTNTAQRTSGDLAIA